MLKYAAFTALAVSSLLSLNAQALDVTVNNTTEETASFAFSYLDKDSGEWMVDGWYNVAGGKKEIIALNTVNTVYYLYAELKNGSRIEAASGQGAELSVFDGAFVYAQKKLPAGEGETVRFVRAQSRDNAATINLN